MSFLLYMFCVHSWHLYMWVQQDIGSFTHKSLLYKGVTKRVVRGNKIPVLLYKNTKIFSTFVLDIPGIKCTNA